MNDSTIPIHHHRATIITMETEEKERAALMEARITGQWPALVTAN